MAATAPEITVHETITCLDGRTALLRRATTADAEEIWQLYHRVYQGNYSLPIVNLRADRDAALRDPACLWLVVEGPDGQLVMPKLFRRCTDYLADVERGFGGTLADWLQASRSSRQRDEDDRVLVADRYEARLSDLLLLRHRRVALQADPLDLAFVEH